jgi:hypothetical protein
MLAKALDSEYKASSLVSERFHAITANDIAPTIADSLTGHYASSKALLNVMAEYIAIAQIGGYWFFSDGSEVAQ